MKKLLFVLLTLTICIGMTACGGTKTDTKTDTSDEPTVTAIERTVDAVATELGLTGGSETYYSMIGAIAGKEFNDGAIEIYQYDLTSEEYAKIKNGEASNGITFAAYNNGFAIVSVKGDNSAIVTKFKALTIKD